MTRPILIDYDPKPIPVRRFDYVAARARLAAAACTGAATGSTDGTD